MRFALQLNASHPHVAVYDANYPDRLVHSLGPIGHAWSRYLTIFFGVSSTISGTVHKVAGQISTRTFVVFIVQLNRRNPSTGLLKWITIGRSPCRIHIELRSDVWKRPSGVSGSSYFSNNSTYEHETCVRRRCAASTRPDASPKHTLNSTQGPSKQLVVLSWASHTLTRYKKITPKHLGYFHFPNAC